MVQRIGLIVGNGMALSLRQFLSPRLDEWDPRCPLSWQLATPGKPWFPLLQSLPRFAAAIRLVHNQSRADEDFKVFAAILHHLDEYMPLTSEQFVLKAEMRHFLAIAYSHFQLAVNQFPFQGWPWLEWIGAVKDDLVGAVSFNYDLILEKTLAQVGASFRRFGLVEEKEGVPIVKPHGSIDFEVSGDVQPVEYPITKLITYTNKPRRRLRDEELLRPRAEVDIVLPQEQSPFLDYQWVAPGYHWFSSIGPLLTKCLLIGLSYSSADRPEIDYLLECLSPETEVIIANPHPPAALLTAARRRGRFVTVWSTGPQRLN
ncbi:hypothetical protein [Sporolituus thermophilus]|uniref:SIR2-like domain-containing protein n=1 Tax=Sporolituus thermophilus DSM 23256 TaxID=1123285 RepID=A0A1G7NPN2_9FIRM|nr:hypothetical protein [Sporolituus thermophilus]SDF75936.1 hypothetical protein SAMN05660235_02650 [Sporolituus thermophilus DSM 23256]